MTPPQTPTAATSGGSFRWPRGHSGWVFHGTSQFEGAMTSFLAEGYAKGERLMLVADDPRIDLWPRHFFDQGVLLIASTSEIYGDNRIIEASSQRETFAEALAEALGDGYSGIRVGADNTSLVEGAERLEAWMAWEEVADQFMAENPVTGLCTFDRTRMDDASLARVMGAHGVQLTD